MFVARYSVRRGETPRQDIIAALDLANRLARTHSLEFVVGIADQSTGVCTDVGCINGSSGTTDGFLRVLGW